jgi:hypothetical protein
MATYTITQEQFDHTNKLLSDLFKMKYQYIYVGDHSFHLYENKTVPWNKGRPWSKEEKKVISQSRKGQPSPFKGKKRPELQKSHSTDSKVKMSIVCKNRPKTSCVLCKKVISGQSNFLQHYKFNH